MQSQTPSRTSGNVLRSLAVATTLLLTLTGFSPSALAEEPLGEVPPIESSVSTDLAQEGGEEILPDEGESDDGEQASGNQATPREGGSDEGNEAAKEQDTAPVDEKQLASDQPTEGETQLTTESLTSPTDANPTQADPATPEATDPAASDPAVGTEADSLAASAYASQWVYEGGSYYYYDETGSKKTGWHIDDNTPLGNKSDLQRYWLDTTTGALAVSRLISPEEAGWWAYARPYGRIVRDKYVDPNTGYVYLANNDGKLEDPGWLVSGSYGDGLQRYYIDETAHACVPGYSTDGWSHYTTKAGYVLRGGTNEGGTKRVANNDGLISDGWVVTSDLGQGLQRYWQQGGAVVSARLIQTGTSTWTYARPEGYVVRGVYVDIATGFVYLANNDGRLETPGWLVTNVYHGSWQRYYIDGTSHAAQPGFFTAAMPGRGTTTGSFFAIVGAGYVTRGKAATSFGVLLANNEGILAENDHGAGWACTNLYDGSIQRYYLESFEGHLYAKTGFFVVNAKTYYGRSDEGYCLRGKLPTANGVLLADNDAVLAETGHKAGWVIEGTYDGRVLQRYYLQEVNGHLYAKTGFFSVNSRSYCGDPTQGYVIRNAQITYKDVPVVANNDGVLRYLTGVLVTVPSGGGSDPLRVLLIGNSFTYYNDDELSSVLSQLTGANVVARTKGGATLHSYVAQQNEVGVQIIRDLAQGGWDFVVIQEQSTRAIDNFAGYLSDLTDLANRARNGGATPIVFGTWAYHGGEGADSRGITVNAMHQQLQSAFTRAANAISAPLANVGQAFADRNFANWLYSDDDKHPSESGSSLAGQIIARVINSLL